MIDPSYIGIMGGPKAGKTHFAGTLFTSELIRPERVLYYDNHGSTDMESLPKWTEKEPWGVRQVDPEKPEQLLRYILELRNKKWSKGVYPYDAIAVDDWSEFAQADIDERLEDDTKIAPKHWGEHANDMKSAARFLYTDKTRAHHLAIFQAALLPDPLEKKPQDFDASGRPKFTMDTRPVRLRPFIQGQFASWIAYKMDALFYMQKEVHKGKFTFQMLMAETDKVAIYSRWLKYWVENPRMSKYLKDPTFDKMDALLSGLAPAEIGAEEQDDN